MTSHRPTPWLLAAAFLMGTTSARAQMMATSYIETAYLGSYNSILASPASLYVPTTFVASAPGLVETAFYTPTAFATTSTILDSYTLAPTYYSPTYYARTRRAYRRALRYAPTVYAPTVYTPTVYAPTIYETPVIATSRAIAMGPVATSFAYPVVQTSATICDDGPAPTTAQVPTTADRGAAADPSKTIRSNPEKAPSATIEAEPGLGGAAAASPTPTSGTAKERSTAAAPPTGTGGKTATPPAPPVAVSPTEQAPPTSPAPAEPFGPLPTNEASPAMQPPGAYGDNGASMDPTRSYSRRPSSYGTPARSILQGRVLSGDTGTPAEGVRIVASDRLRRYADKVAMSDAFGHYAISLPEGDWTLKVTMPSGRVMEVGRGDLTAGGGLVTDAGGKAVRNLTITR